MSSFQQQVTVEQEIEIEFDLECSTCGKSLSCTIGARNHYDMHKAPTIRIDPCQKCLDEAEENGRSEA